MWIHPPSSSVNEASPSNILGNIFKGALCYQNMAVFFFLRLMLLLWNYKCAVWSSYSDEKEIAPFSERWIMIPSFTQGFRVGNGSQEEIVQKMIRLNPMGFFPVVFDGSFDKKWPPLSWGTWSEKNNQLPVRNIYAGRVESKPKGYGSLLFCGCS